MTKFGDRIEALGNEEFLDSIIISHGFTPYGRDYDVILLTVAALPSDVPIGETTGTYIDGRYRYRFTHVPEAHLHTEVEPKWWRESWDDLFIDYEAWHAAGTPEGHVSGAERADAYPACHTLRVLGARSPGLRLSAAKCTRYSSRRTSSSFTSSVTTSQSIARQSATREPDR